MQDIRGNLASWKQLVDDRIAAFYDEELARRDYTSSFYRKIHAELADYSARGKRLRSLLLMIGYLGSVEKLTDEDLERLAPIAVAVELLHSHFLIHDDIVDRDDYRRGGSSMQNRLEEVTPRGAVTEPDFAIVAGDLVLSQAIEVFVSADFPPSRVLTARKIAAEAMIQTNIGKLYDLLDTNQSLERIEFEHILFVMTYRTSRYTIQMPLALGATLAGGDGNPERFEEFANLLGTAFHLYHDVSHTEGEVAQIRRDIRENKKTLLLKWLYDAGSDDERRFLSELMGTKVSDADYARVKSLLDSKGIIARAQKYITELLTDAEAEIENLGFNETGVAYLRHIMRALAGQEEL